MRIFRWQSLRIIITDILVWVLAMIVYVFLKYYDPVETPLHATAPLIEFDYTLWLGLQAGLILGLVYGLVDVFLDQHWLRKRSYGSVLLIKAIIHFIIIISLSILFRIEVFNKMDIELTVAEIRSSYNPNIVIMLLYTTLVNFMINFTRQITLKFGPGNLTRFLTGKFHHPKEETRIFMFLDMKDSTSHAEALGHVEFGQLIQDCFSDLTIIENRKSEVYQYVGDEAIVYWEVDKGIQELNCVWAYFDFKRRLDNRSGYYLKRYGILPEFKSGMNIGQVTVAEIGDIKRDLAFLGDTMNTAARIQGLCNKLEADLLISEDLHQQLPASKNITRTFVDNLSLRGKRETIAVYSVALNST